MSQAAMALVQRIDLTYNGGEVREALSHYANLEEKRSLGIEDSTGGDG
jgi:hypothetical protein